MFNTFSVCPTADAHSTSLVTQGCMFLVSECMASDSFRRSWVGITAELIPNIVSVDMLLSWHPHPNPNHYASRGFFVTYTCTHHTHMHYICNLYHTRTTHTHTHMHHIHVHTHTHTHTHPHSYVFCGGAVPLQLSLPSQQDQEERENCERSQQNRRLG